MTKIPRETTAYFLVSGGYPRRFVCGESCPCSSLSMATFFPDYATAAMIAAAHCNSDTKIMECTMKVGAAYLTTGTKK